MSQVEGQPLAQRRWVMLCIVLGMVLSSLDSSIANIALPVIARALGSSNASTVMVVNGYQLAVTVCLLPVATLSESQGLKRVYGFGLAIFTLASLSCALSSTLSMLVSARVVQGVGGACMAVAGMALVRTIYPRSMVSHGVALVALAVAVAGATGPTVAASILAIASWHWLFLVNVPLGLAALLVFLLLAPPSVRRSRPLDLTGALFNALAFGFIVVGVATLRIGDATIPVAEILFGLVCLALLIRQQTRRISPLLPLDLIRIPVFALSVGTSICSYAAQILAYASLPFFFEQRLHFSAIRTGFLLTPWPLLVALSAPIAGRLMARYTAAAISSTGMVLLAVGLLLMAMVPDVSTTMNIVWRMAICGIGFGLCQTPNNTTIMMSGPSERSGAASGMTALARYLGGSLGSAVVALIFGFGGHATALCLETGAGFAILGAILSGSRHQDVRVDHS